MNKKGLQYVAALCFVVIQIYNFKKIILTEKHLLRQYT